MATLVTHAGWRVMTLSLAAVVMIFVPMLAWLMRDRPADLGLSAYGDTSVAGPAPLRSGNPITAPFRALADRSRSRDFWLTHLIPACVDHGLGEVVGAERTGRGGVVRV